MTRRRKPARPLLIQRTAVPHGCTRIRDASAKNLHRSWISALEPAIFFLFHRARRPSVPHDRASTRSPLSPSGSDGLSREFFRRSSLFLFLFSSKKKKKNNDKIAMQLRYYDDFQAYDDRLEIVEGVFKRGTVSVSRMGEKAGSSTS